MSRRVRLDAELVRRGLARSREHSATLINDGAVLVSGIPATKPATQVGTDQPIVITAMDDPQWASRGAHKLLGALEVFEPLGLSVAHRICLDAGASTGGFTDVLLRSDARRVHAVDVGYGQLVWSLRTDRRVVVHDRTNVRALTPDTLDEQVDVVVSDLSFISLTVVLAALTAVCKQEGDLVLMIKPQFEVGRENLGKNGVVRDPAQHIRAIRSVCDRAGEFGWGTKALAASPLPGPAGNIEYFCWLRTDASGLSEQAAVDVVAAGPTGAGR